MSHVLPQALLLVLQPLIKQKHIIHMKELQKLHDCIKLKVTLFYNKCFFHINSTKLHEMATFPNWKVE